MKRLVIRSGFDAEMPVGRERIADLPLDEIGVFLLPETLRHPQHGHIEDSQAVMPVHIFAGDTDPGSGGNLLCGSITTVRGTVDVADVVIGKHFVRHTAQQSPVVGGDAWQGRQKQQTEKQQWFHGGSLQGSVSGNKGTYYPRRRVNRNVH